MNEHLATNRRLFESLQDDAQRARLYADLESCGFPPLAFKSVLRTGGDPARWPSEDAYLLTGRKDIERALRTGSVKPYAALDSGGQFMLGQDSPGPHRRQRTDAIRALDFSASERDACVGAAVERAMVLPRRLREFDLVTDVAEEAALRLIALLFGMPAKSHVLLQQAMRATYRRLTFQIIGRHFVPDDGLPPSDSDTARELREKLHDQVHGAADPAEPPEWWDDGLLAESAARRLGNVYGAGSEMTRVVVLGLMAGTVGNVTSAIANTVEHFFETDDGAGGRLIDHASSAARHGGRERLDAMIDDAMRRRPPAPFLARTAGADMEAGGGVRIPAGSHLLLAMGADGPADLDWIFGGPFEDPAFPHNCIGRHLAWPLVRETVRQVLLLPGLARVIDPATERPKPLVKSWGAICKSLPLRYQRDRRLNQQPLFLTLPIKAPIAENAVKLEALTRAGAPVVERALNDAKNVHFAWFGLTHDRTHLTMYTVYDGDFDAYVEHFALKVPLFDEQFKYLEGAPPSPVRLYPKEFVDFIRKHNNRPLGGYFYSAYPRLGVGEIHNQGLDEP